jgi:hypothetical protein
MWFSQVSQRRISINTMARSTKTSWGLTCMITEQGITTQHLVGL